MLTTKVVTPYDAHGDFAKVPISNWWFNPVLALAVVSRWHAA